LPGGCSSLRLTLFDFALLLCQPILFEEQLSAQYLELSLDGTRLGRGGVNFLMSLCHMGISLTDKYIDIAAFFVDLALSFGRQSLLLAVFLLAKLLTIGAFLIETRLRLGTFLAPLFKHGGDAFLGALDRCCLRPPVQYQQDEDQ
jgi:hypothetical protein